ncbi:nucleotide kinase domain-containing protein [Crocinitomix catalasitica]|uniref:nucleotide kinase domain-containing protein n=1 Tax=Crocinitomix catalasitica TaxID=184607 RepID=UPI000480ADD7|nr:nucleotide kinase domain-containing protein [Crocinitomix catalasitica]
MEKRNSIKNNDAHAFGLKPTIVFDTYWKFAVERQNIFYNKIHKESLLTNDVILQEYKFTNVYRVLDRVSQYLISDVIYRHDNDPRNILFRILLFKIFNKIETWDYLEHELDGISYDSFDFDRYDNVLTSLLDNKVSIYSAAYIMASAKSRYGQRRKHQNHLLMIEEMIEDGLAEKLMRSKDMKEGYELMLCYPSIGTFLAYQLITDINYSEITNYSEMEFVKAGPGAIEGIQKCFSDIGNKSYEDIIRYVTNTQEYHFQRLDLNFSYLNKRKLRLIDCQNIFCEVAKYSRVAHPEFSGLNGRKRIKQKYKPKSKEIQYCFPNKWNLEI